MRALLGLIVAAALGVSASPARAAGPIPPEIQKCLAKGSMWLAQPAYFERFEFDDAGKKRTAYQILDRNQGALGYLLVYAEDCRIVVMILGPTRPERPAERSVGFSSPPGAPPMSAAERAVLLRFAEIAPASSASSAPAAWARDEDRLWVELKEGAPGVRVRARRRTNAGPWPTGAGLHLRRLLVGPESELRVLELNHLTAAEDRIAVTGAAGPGPPLAVRPYTLDSDPGYGAIVLENARATRVLAYVGPIPELEPRIVRRGSTLWLLARRSPETGLPRVLRVDLLSLDRVELELDLGVSQVRASLAEAGLSLGPFGAPDRVLDFALLDRWAGSAGR